MKSSDKLLWDRSGGAYPEIPFDIVRIRPGIVKGRWYHPYYAASALAYFNCPLCGQRLDLIKEQWTISRRGLVWPTVEELEYIASLKAGPTCLNDLLLNCVHTNCTFKAVIQLVGWFPKP